VASGLTIASRANRTWGPGATPSRSSAAARGLRRLTSQGRPNGVRDDTNRWTPGQRAQIVSGAPPVSTNLRLTSCRHTYAGFVIAAGVNVKALQAFLGHASITMTLDLYGHLLPGSDDEAAALIDAYLARGE
jgi:integrase